MAKKQSKIATLFRFLFGNAVLKHRLKSLHKYSAGVHRLDKAIQGSDLSPEVKCLSQALNDTYGAYLVLLAAKGTPDYTSILKDKLADLQASAGLVKEMIAKDGASDG